MPTSCREISHRSAGFCLHKREREMGFCRRVDTHNWMGHREDWKRTYLRPDRQPRNDLMGGLIYSRSSDKLQCLVILPVHRVTRLSVEIIHCASILKVYKTVGSTVFRARSRPVFYLRQLTPPTQNTLHNERLDPHLFTTASPGRQLRCSSLTSSQTLDRVPQVSRFWARF